jgi:hypothetical protein
MYKLYYKNEEVDTALNQQEADYLQQEYSLAFKHPIVVKEFPKLCDQCAESAWDYDTDTGRFCSSCMGDQVGPTNEALFAAFGDESMK